jgi:hypothetical protein
VEISVYSCLRRKAGVQELQEFRSCRIEEVTSAVILKALKHPQSSSSSWSWWVTDRSGCERMDESKEGAKRREFQLYQREIAGDDEDEE